MFILTYYRVTQIKMLPSLLTLMSEACFYLLVSLLCLMHVCMHFVYYDSSEIILEAYTVEHIISSFASLCKVHILSYSVKNIVFMHFSCTTFPCIFVPKMYDPRNIWRGHKIVQSVSFAIDMPPDWLTAMFVVVELAMLADVYFCYFLYIVCT
jgi:hypothetical protein